MSEWSLWENWDGSIKLEAAYNPAISRNEGCHLVLLQKVGLSSPWADPDFYAKMQRVAARVAEVLIELGMADWVNIHYDGNIGAANGKPFLHIHIFGRLKTGEHWGGPLQLPAGEGPYGNEPLNDKEIERLRSALNRAHL